MGTCWMVMMLIMCAAVLPQKWAYTPLLASGNQAFTGVLGLDFDVKSPILVYQMGCFNNNEGLQMSSLISVGIYNRSSMLLVPETVAQLRSTNTKQVGFIAVYELEHVVALPVGSYTVAAVGYSANFMNLNGAGNGPTSSTDGADSCMLYPDGGDDVINFVGKARFLHTVTSLSFPTIEDTGPESRYGAGTFSFLPAKCPQVWMKAESASAAPNSVVLEQWQSLSSTLILTNKSGAGIEKVSNCINFNPCVSFAGGSSGLMTGNLASALILAPTIITVSKIARPDGSRGSAGLFETLGSTGASYGVSQLNESMTIGGSTSVSSSSSCCTCSEGVAGEWVVTTAQYSTQLSLVGATLSVNGATQNLIGFNNTCVPPVARPNTTIALGPGVHREGPTEIAEVMLFSTSYMTAQVKNAVESYLALKYGLTKLGNYTSSNGTIVYSSVHPFVNDVFGIGRDVNTTLDQRISSSSSTSSSATEQKNLVIASTSDLSSSSSDMQRIPMADGQFVVCGADRGSLGFTDRWPKLSRTWRCEVTGGVSRLFVGLHASAVAFPAGDARVPVMLVSINATFPEAATSLLPLSGVVQQGSGDTILQSKTALDLSYMLLPPQQSSRVFYLTFADLRLLTQSRSASLSLSLSTSNGVSSSDSISSTKSSASFLSFVSSLSSARSFTLTNSKISDTESLRHSNSSSQVSNHSFSASDSQLVPTTQTNSRPSRSWSQHQADSSSIIASQSETLQSTMTARMSTATSANMFSASSTILIHVPLVPIVSAGTLSATRSAMSLSVVAASATGPGGASDLQAMVLMMLARCTASSSAVVVSTGGYMLLTPFALSDSSMGAIGGNALAFVSLLAVQLIRFVFLRFWRVLPLHEAAAGARLPGFALLMTASLHQSTMFASIRLLDGDGTTGFEVAVGVFALLASLALPPCVIYAAARVPRMFVLYDLAAGSRFASFPWTLVVPNGTTLPQTTRLMASPLITAFVFPSPAYVSLAFVSSLMTNFVALLPRGSPVWICAGAMYMSAAVHLSLGMLVLFRSLYRFPSSTILGAVGFGLVGVFHAQLASGWRNWIDAMMTIQSVVSILRSAAAIVVTVLEGRMQSDSSVGFGKVMWRIGLSDNLSDEQEMLLDVLVVAAPSPAEDGPAMSISMEIDEGMQDENAEEEVEDDYSSLRYDERLPPLVETAATRGLFGTDEDDDDVDDLQRLYRSLGSSEATEQILL